MALQPCRECRHAVSTEALACPSCGASQPAGAVALRVSDGAAVQGHARANGAGPTPEFWIATRLVLRRMRIGFYGMGSAVFAAMLTGSFLLGTGADMVALGVLLAIGACLLAIIIEFLELNLGKGGAHED